MARCAAEEYTVLIYEPRSRAFSRLPLQNLSDEMAARLCPRGIPNYDVGRTALFSPVVNVRPRRREIARRQARDRIALSSVSSERHGYIRIKVFSHSPMQSAPGSSRMSFRAYAISECDECSLVRIVAVSAHTLDSTRVRASDISLWFGTVGSSDIRFDSIFPALASPAAIEL